MCQKLKINTKCFFFQFCKIYECFNMSLNNIYHEKQIRELCLVHALNNLFQSKIISSFSLINNLFIIYYILAKEEFMKSELDNICKKLSPEQWINPHRYLIL